MAVTAAVGSAVIGAGASIYSANKQASAANSAANTQLSMYNQTRSDLLPYMQGGSAAFSQLMNLMGIGGGASMAGYGPQNYGSSGQAVLSVLNDPQYARTFGPAMKAQIQQMINNGAPLSDINSYIQNWGAHTTSSSNAAAKSALFGATGGLSPVAPTAGAGGGSSMLDTLRNYPGYQFALDQGTQALDRSAASRGLLLSGGQLKDVTNYGQGMADQLFGTYYNQLSGIAGLGENAAAGAGNAGATAAAGAAKSQLAGGTAAASGIAGAANNIGGLLQSQNFQALFNSPANDGSIFGSAQGAADIGSLAMSDRRMKTDIVRVGRADSGLPIYTYRFKGSPLPQMGVMAQDVEKIAPHAVHTDRRGIKHVDYRAVSRLPSIERMAA